VARHTREVVRRARLEESLRDEKRVLEMVNRTGQALASTLDLGTLLQAITDAGTALAGARLGAFFYNTQDEHGELLQLYTLSGASREAMERLGRPRSTDILRPTFHGDTIYSESTVLEKRESRSQPDRGVVTVETRAYNQHGELVMRYRRSVMVPKREAGLPHTFPEPKTEAGSREG